jgi:uncharacterized membrane protein (DUF4010 family)
MTSTQALLAFLVAGALGFVVGLERQFSPHGSEGYAGARTFALYGMWGAAAGLIGDRYGGLAVAAALVAAAALIIASYLAFMKVSGDLGTTSEAAALMVFAIGLLSWEAMWVAAIGATVAVTALLRAKDVLHAVAHRFSDEDVKTFLQFAVVTAVVLPLVPDQAIGRFEGFNPREVWLMVVFVSAIGLAGYVALRLFGSRGLVLTGLLGGLVSSTAVTMSFSRMARADRQPAGALAAGVLAACGLMFARVLIEAVVLAPALAASLAPWLLTAFVVVEAAALIWWRRSSRSSPQTGELVIRNPLTLTVALAFGAVYAVVAFASRAAIELVDESSLSIVGAVSGLNDVDAITLSMGNLVHAGLPVEHATAAVLAAVTVNTLVKAMLAITIGGRMHGRRVGPVLGVAAAVTAVAWLVS